MGLQRYRRAIIVLWGACWVSAAPAADDADRQALLAESLLHSALNLYHTPDAAARAGRLVALSDVLASLHREDPPVRRLLADVYQSLGRLESAADAAEALWKANPDDFAAGERWLRFRLEILNRAEQRAAFLQSLRSDANISPALRSVAAVEQAGILLGQGDEKGARQMLEESLRLDPWNRAALLALPTVRNPFPPQEGVGVLLALLRGNPRSWQTAWELAMRLGDLGLYEEALAYYRHTWALWQGQRHVSNAPEEFAVSYVSALLDAEKPQIAVELFQPALDRLKTSPEFLSLMIEAFTKAGRETDAQPLRKAVEDLYRRQLLTRRLTANLDVSPTAPPEKGTKMTADLAVHLAWFYLLVEKRPEQARRSIAEAVELGASGEAVDLCKGAALLASGRAEGLPLLQPLAKKYPLAAAYLAKHQLETGQTRAGEKTLLDGLAKERRNLAGRMLRTLARKYHIAVPPPPGASQAAARLQQYDPRVLEMGLQPSKYIRISLEGPREAPAPGEPILVQAVLENIGPLPVSVDAWGLLDRRLGFRLESAGGEEASLASLPMLTWPAPRYLAPGQTVSAVCRLDVGSLERFLVRRPLSTVELRIEPIVSPTEIFDETRDETRRVWRVVSGLEPMKLPVLTIRRRSLIASEPPSAESYRVLSDSLTQTLTKGDLPARVLAAKRIAALLALQRDPTAPAAIRAVLDEADLLRKMMLALQDRDELVRAEMIAGLQYADAGEAMLNEIGRVVEDPSPLVRLRVAEMIGASETAGRETLIARYAADPDGRVRTMARAFLHAWKHPEPPPRDKR